MIKYSWFWDYPPPARPPNMQIKILSIFALLLPWFQAPVYHEVPLSLPTFKQVKPIKQPDLKPIATAEPVYIAPPPLPTSDAKAFIYEHESGNNPLAQNSLGCLGLGQACPGSKLLIVCPTLDYACEDSYFTGYMQDRYTTWENARSFWIANHWW